MHKVLWSLHGHSEGGSMGRMELVDVWIVEVLLSVSEFRMEIDKKTDEMSAGEQLSGVLNKRVFQA
jgi:hypothetical protein